MDRYKNSFEEFAKIDYKQTSPNYFTDKNGKAWHFSELDYKYRQWLKNQP